MNNINHHNIRLISEDLTAYDTTIACELPLPKFINDTKRGRLFQKVKTIFESGQSRVTYSEVLVTSLSSVEVVAEWVDTEPPNRNDYEFREEYDEALKEWTASVSPVDAKYSVVE